MKSFTILGAGSWGTAMAIHLSRKGETVYLVPRRQEHADELKLHKRNLSYLPDHSLPNNLNVTTDLTLALQSPYLFLACPSKGLKDLCSLIAPFINEQQQAIPKIIVSLCKGLDQASLSRPTQLMSQFFPTSIIAALSGPNGAAEIADGKPAAATLASESDSSLLSELQKNLSNQLFRVYRSHDLVGVELASCLKNVYAIGGGVCDGLQLGDNAKASYLTRALHELVRIGSQLGGQTQTFYGLSGFGDLVATSFGGWSRNRTFGQKVAQGGGVEEILSQQKTVVEGYWSTNTFHKLISQKGIESPLLNEIYSILYEGKDPRIAISELMQRNLKIESN